MGGLNNTDMLNKHKWEVLNIDIDMLVAYPRSAYDKLQFAILASLQITSKYHIWL